MHEPPGGPALTPMFRQYHQFKREHPGAILLFRMGDFYEMFFDDAKDASRILDLTLTARGKGTDTVAAMCGFPHHQLDPYAARLVRAGRRVAVCDQVEDPRQARGLVKRAVVRVITPGTVTDPKELPSKENCWLAGAARTSEGAGLAFLDASTGEFLAWEVPEGADPREAIAERLRTFAPREVVHPEGFPWPEVLAGPRPGEVLLTTAEPYAFTPSAGGEILRRHLGTASLDGFGLRGRPAATAAAGGLLAWLQETQKSGLEHVDRIALHEPSRTLLLDPATRRNLEIDRSVRDGGRGGTLLDAVDRTVTSAGGRLLRQWLLAPLLDAAQVEERLDAVAELRDRGDLRADLQERLRGIQDLERLTGRIVGGTAGPRDLLALGRSLARLPGLKEALASLSAALPARAGVALDPCADLADRLAHALADEPPATLKDGGVFRDGFDPALDELRTLRRDGRSAVAAIEERERARTGIASLKVRYNKVFGYYLEVSRPNLPLVPEDYRRKQTIAGGERFVTDELKDLEDRILHAQERMEALEAELFAALRDAIAREARRIKDAARTAALADVLAGLAEAAAEGDWRRPRIVEEPVLRVAGGRHPVVERTLADARFVPNDTHLDGAGKAVAILTGPNMGGKSTYLRQNALIVLLAQAGSFVPAEEATVGLTDRIFCRVGASDSLSEGQSTFMVEMTETAHILHHATPRSLVLLDEIGRGTSTFDGLSIAWAVAEHLHGRPGGPPRTLFATHYHEMTELAVELPGVANLRIAVRERGDQVVFLHRVEEGASDRSYGIHVARLAGVPPPVVARAREILANLEKDEFGKDGLPRRARRKGERRAPSQPLLFAAPGEDPPDPEAAAVLAELRRVDPERITPLQALALLSSWRRRLRGDAEPDAP